MIKLGFFKLILYLKGSHDYFNHFHDRSINFLSLYIDIADSEI